MDKSVDGNPKYILSYGGGVNTVALLLFLIKEKRPLDEVVFADTGGELPETYEHAKMMERHLTENGISFRVVKSKNGTLYDRCIRRHVIPSQVWRWCTRDLKITPIYAYYRSLGVHVNQYLGISYEEKDRVRDSGVPYVTNLYPLVEKQITREQCVDLIHKEGLKIPVRSGCFFCPFNSVSRWVEINRNHRDLYIKAMELEENSKHFPKQQLMKLSLRGLDAKLIGHEPLPQVLIKRRCGSECVT